MNKAGVNKRMKERKKITLLCAGAMALIVIAASKMMLQAETSEKINSRGTIRYTDKSGAEVLFDAGDLEMLFQSAAKGKNGMIQALSGIGTNFFKTEERWQYSAYPEREAETVSLQSAEELSEMTFNILGEALADSQKLPQEYTDTYSLATSDNLTLGNAAWADGSLLLGNNHDVLESYAKGWMEGAGYQSMQAIKDENGNVTGYLFE